MKCILTLLGLSLVLGHFFYANAQNSQYPFTGVAISIPGKVEAENYDLGEQDIAYNDADALNQGNSYRTDGVDIEACSEGGYNIAFMVTGEWLEYTVNVATSTNYRIDLRTASNQLGCLVRLDVDGIAVTREISLPNTGDWQNWATTSIAAVPLAAGTHTLRLLVAAGGFNLNAIDFYAAAVINKLPVVSISAPSNGTTFTAPASFSINANAIDSDGAISKVEFYSGTTLLGTSVSAPYSYSWSNVQAGTYAITAKATDNLGGVTVSPAVTLVIITTTVVVPNQIPNVVLTSPLTNTIVNAPANIVLTADATDSDGSISRVEFYNGSVLLGSDNSTPYSYVWSNLGTGLYNFTAKAFDDQGAVSKLSTVSIVTVVSVVLADPCLSVASYMENGSYVAGSKVKNVSSRYECKPWPYSIWCSGAAWAYAPGSGAYWSDAWTLIGSCNTIRSLDEGIETNASDELKVSPNPFSISTVLSITIKESGDVSLKVYDKSGQYLKTIVEDYLVVGSYRFPLIMPPGFYHVKFITKSGSSISRIIQSE